MVDLESAAERSMTSIVALAPGKMASGVTRKTESLPGFTTSDLFNGYKPADYIVKNVVEPGELAVWFGESGAMKSFAVIDLAMHIATGREYCGHRVVHSGVVYVAGEGGEGIKRRLKAWMVRHGIGEFDPRPCIFVATQPADLMFDGGTIRATIEQASDILGATIGLVIFDTLAASFGDGDENATADMSKALQTARLTCGDERAIILVHHVGHGEKTRERGAYALRAAADRRVLVERPEDGPLVTLKCAKAKDGEPFKPLSFEWRQVELGWFDADGDELTSVILEPTERQPERAEPCGKVQKAIAASIKEHGPAKKTEIVKRLEAYRFNRTAIYKAIAKGLDDGFLVEGFDKISLPESAT